MVRMDAELRVRLPADMSKALGAAARRQMERPSTYVRQALLAKLVADGFLSEDGETLPRGEESTGVRNV